MKIFKFILIFVFIAPATGLCDYAWAHPPKGYRYYFPEKYAGWVCISYNVDGAPPLPVEGGFHVVKIPPNGILKTCSDPRLSPTINEYFYYNQSGTRKAEELRLGGGGSRQIKGEKVSTFQFWVSSGNLESDYEQYVKCRDMSSGPKCGPWNPIDQQ